MTLSARREDKKEEDIYPEKDTEHEILQNYLCAFQPQHFVYEVLITTIRIQSAAAVYAGS